MNPRRIAPHVPAAEPVDVEPLNEHVVGAHADDGPVARSDEPRASAADQAERAIDHEIAAVCAGANLERAARSRLVDQRLDGRRFASRRASFERAGGRRGHVRRRRLHERKKKERAGHHGYFACPASPGLSCQANQNATRRSTTDTPSAYEAAAGYE